MIEDVINLYHRSSKADIHHRYKSWEHCFGFFSQNHSKMDDFPILNSACLNLGFYLASWGMMRGGAFLLQKDYLIHKYFIESVVKGGRYTRYYASLDDGPIATGYYSDVDALIHDTERAYIDNISVVNDEETTVNVSDTLASKILLGVFGCVPAYDRYFKEGLRFHGIRPSLDRCSLEELRLFYNDNLTEFDRCRKAFQDDVTYYTPMKLVDMYFWQLGYMASLGEALPSWVPVHKTNIANHDLKGKSETTSAKSRQKKPGLTESVRKRLIEKLEAAQQKGMRYLEVRAGDLEKEMGLSNRIVVIINAMRSIPGFVYEVVSEPPKGYSTSVIYRYPLS